LSWGRDRYKTFKNSAEEHSINAPSGYRGPEVEPGVVIDSIGLVILTEKITGLYKYRYDVVLVHGMFPTDYEIGWSKDKDSASGLALGFMNRYDTWTKVLNYLKKIHGFNLRTYGI